MTDAAIAPSESLKNVRYEIRGRLARRAHELQRQGYEIISLNIGNPRLFGFRTPEELGFFNLLLTVTGVGPKVAMAMIV